MLLAAKYKSALLPTDDTVGLLRKFLNQAALLTVDRIILLHDRINSHVKASPDRNRIHVDGPFSITCLHIALRQLRTVCNLTDDLIIVISNSSSSDNLFPISRPPLPNSRPTVIT